jgi:hypothetical protein
MCNETFNGWANHATWLVNLWLGEYDYNPSELLGLSRYDATQALKETVDNILTNYEDAKITGFAADLIQSTLSDVNWYELANHCIKDLPEEDDNE